MHRSITWDEIDNCNETAVMYRNQRRLLRGCREIQHCECSPLKNFPPDEVLGFEKDSGAAGGGGEIGVNGKPQKGSFDDALTGATMLEVRRSSSGTTVKKVLRSESTNSNNSARE